MTRNRGPRWPQPRKFRLTLDCQHIHDLTTTHGAPPQVTDTIICVQCNSPAPRRVTDMTEVPA